MASLVVLAIRLLYLYSRPRCSEGGLCSDDYASVFIIGFCVVVVILASLYAIDKLAPGGRVPNPLQGAVRAYHPDSDGLEAARPQPSAAADDLQHRLGRLDALRRAGTITAQEYAQRRAEMLREL